MAENNRPPIHEDEVIETVNAVALYDYMKRLHSNLIQKDCIASISLDEDHQEALIRMTDKEILTIHTYLQPDSIVSHVVHVEILNESAGKSTMQLENIYDTMFTIKGGVLQSFGRHYTKMSVPEGDELPADGRLSDSDKDLFNEYIQEIDSRPTADLAELVGLLGLNGVIAK